MGLSEEIVAQDFAEGTQEWRKRFLAVLNGCFASSAVPFALRKAGQTHYHSVNYESPFRSYCPRRRSAFCRSVRGGQRSFQVFSRFVELLDTPSRIPVLAPMILREKEYCKNINYYQIIIFNKCIFYP